ncbi:MAG TPA: hypothetical protein VF202_05885 [Trueperaceae bacterium]
MADRYEKIRKALTMGPTAGPWRCEHETGGGHDCWMIYSGDWPKSGGIVGYYTHTGPRHIPHVRPNIEAVAIAHHIAACDPDTIRMLLEERDALAAELEAIRATHPTDRSESDGA